jgi:hypothetical protein
VRVSDLTGFGPWSNAFTVSDPPQEQTVQTLEVASPFSRSITFAGDTGTLRLDDPASFSGTLAGMTGQDTIDFATIDPTKVQPPSYDPACGKLHVTDGTHTADIALIGNYMASVFVAHDDGHGGTSVVDPPALGGAQPLVTPPHPSG